tara:strand:- start:344 stop:454 length:111 start_codon:yes stop_codon:yes gene_type:complete
MIKSSLLAIAEWLEARSAALSEQLATGSSSLLLAKP